MSIIEDGRQSILVVEDDALQALDMEMLLAAAGYRVVGPAANVGQALELIENEHPSFATLDYNLGCETSAPVARLLRGQGTPFIYVSGRAEDVEADRSAPRACIVEKPATARTILDAVADG
jgi:two-component system, response regulator PdtaR